MKQEQINKPFSISKQLVFDAWKGVKENKGSAGIDISKFFDTINHDLLMKAVKRHVTENWIVMRQKV